jgi:hypothetical protein
MNPLIISRLLRDFFFVIPCRTGLKMVDLLVVVDSCWLIVGGKYNT